MGFLHYLCIRVPLRWPASTFLIIIYLEMTFQACRLISIALARLKESGKQSDDRKLWESMVVQDTQTQVQVKLVVTFISKMNHCLDLSSFNAVVIFTCNIITR